MFDNDHWVTGVERQRAPSPCVAWGFAGAFITILLVSIGTAQPPASNADNFDVIAERYWQIVQQRPRKGTAFDHWYRHYAQAERLEDLRERVEQWSVAEPATARPHLLRGLVLEHDRNPAEALLAYERAEQLAPNDYYSALCRGRLLFRQQRYGDAVQALNRAGELQPERSDLFEIVETLVRCHQREGNRDAARGVWKKAFSDAGGDLQTLQRIAEIVTAENDTEAAIELWQLVVDRSAQDRAVHNTALIEIAQLHADQGKTNEAIERFVRVLEEVKPEGWLARDVCRRIERTFLAGNNSAGLVEFWQKQKAARPPDLQTLQNLARSLQLAGRIDDALIVYRETVDLAPTHDRLRRALLDVLVETGRFDEAIEECEALLAQRGTDIEALRMLGQLHLKAASRDAVGTAQETAIAIWRRIADSRPNDAAAALEAAEACRHAAQVPSSLLSPEEALRPNDSNAALLSAAESLYQEAVERAGAKDARLAVPYLDHLGEFYHALERPDDAAAAWWKICAPPHDSPEMYCEAAEVFMKYGRFTEAEQAIRRAIAKKPRTFDYLELLVTILIERKEFAAAFKELPSLDTAADAPELQARASKLRLQVCLLGKYAVQEIQRLQATTSTENATLTDLWLLASLLTQQGQHDAAAAAFTRAVVIDSANTRLIRDFAQSLENARQFTEAIDQYERLIALEPHATPLHLQSIVQLQLRRGEHDLARKFAERLKQIAPGDPATHKLLVDVGRYSGDRGEHVKLLRQAVRAVPQDIAFRYQLAHTLAEHGDLDDALAEYWHCWDLAPALFERISLVAAMSDVLKPTASWQPLIDRLESERGRHPRDAAICLAEAHRRMGQFAQARRALLHLLVENEDDVDVLRQLAALAAAEKDWSAAMSYQQQVVSLNDSWTNVVDWARYYSESKRDEWLREARTRQRQLMRSWADTFRRYRAQLQQAGANDPATVSLRQELVNLNWARNKYYDKEQVLDPGSAYHRRYGDIWLQIHLDFQVLELASRGAVTTDEVEHRLAESIRRSRTSAAYTLRGLCEKGFLVKKTVDGEDQFSLAKPSKELYAVAIRDFGQRMLGAAIELSDVELSKLDEIVRAASTPQSSQP